MRTESFVTPEPVRLDIRIPAGDVRIDTADTTETMVELEFRGRDAHELEQEARIELRGRDVIVEPAERAFQEGEYDVRVTTPHGADVRADLASADLVGRGRFGEVEANVASGDVQLQEVAGEARINSASGDVEVAQAGPARVNTASGDVRIRRVAEGEVKVQSASGDVEVGIAAGSRLWVDAQSLSGDTSSDLELEGAPSDGEGPLVELRVQTMSGDIAVRRA
jgi:DUF4097 and DUF4098 domain-containing protein YvlB